jgi:(1->4)-alpha-D-glucan 1-alpha-D-glucosylmutase
MLATGTHDTKRGEDMRARLNVLSEMPERWESKLTEWQKMNAEARQDLDGEAVPDANEEVLIYQTLIGTWPLDGFRAESREAYVERIVKYLDKALREAKLHTSWTSPYEEYDHAVRQFIERTLASFDLPFVCDLDRFTHSIADAGFTNSLAQTVIKICAPGVPDFYRGVEFWDFNLVDPDNRRPVDFARRRSNLDSIRKKCRSGVREAAAEFVAAWPDERIKLFTIWRGLWLRKERPELRQGDYVPLECEGTRKANVIAFARVKGDSWTLCIVPRLSAEAWRGQELKPAEGDWPIAEWWRETFVLLPSDAPAHWRSTFDDREFTSVTASETGVTRLDAADLFRRFPVAVLTTERGK